MILELISIIAIEVLIMAFFAEYIDSTLGMGYGTTLTPVLIFLGFDPLQIVPAILLSQFLAGIFAAFMHNSAGNVSFDLKNDYENKIVKRLGRMGYIPRSTDSKVAIVLTICGVIGMVVAVLVAINIPTFYLKLYIGVLVLAMGIVILIKHKTEKVFSWNRIITLGVLASFNKGMSGGGYGPLVTSGQILSGVNAKSSIAITSLAEGLTCFIGVVAYLIASIDIMFIDWSLAPTLVLGSLMSVPLSVYTVKKMQTKEFTLIIGLATTCLGSLTLLKLLFEV